MDAIDDLEVRMDMVGSIFMNLVHPIYWCGGWTKGLEGYGPIIQGADKNWRVSTNRTRRPDDSQTTVRRPDDHNNDTWDRNPNVDSHTSSSPYQLPVTKS